MFSTWAGSAQEKMITWQAETELWAQVSHEMNHDEPTVLE